jgi:hypothetical protein
MPRPYTPLASHDAIQRNVLDRAAMVGGEKFAREYQHRLLIANDFPRPGREQNAVVTPELYWFANEMSQWKRSNPKVEFLVDQSTDDLYYVVASEYDYAAAVVHERHLLWQTRMTVNAHGVSERQTSPALIASAAPYFGRDMNEPAVITPRTKNGVVEIGPAIVIENDVPLPAERAPSSAK